MRDGDPGLEHLAVPLRIELLQLADQVAGLGVSGRLIAGRLHVQKHQDRGQQQRHQAEEKLAGTAARKGHESWLIAACLPIRRSGS